MSFHKFANTVLYLLKNSPSEPGKTKLLKLLYFADFGFYREQLRPISGAEYVALPNGPVPDNFERSLERMINEGWLRREMRPMPQGLNPMEVFVPLAPLSEEAFDEEEMGFLDIVLQRWGTATGSRMSTETHQEDPWRMFYDANSPGKPIPYRSARWNTRSPSPAHLTHAESVLSQPRYQTQLQVLRSEDASAGIDRRQV